MTGSGRWRFAPGPDSAAEARAITRKFLGELGPEVSGTGGPGAVDADAAVLVVSELVANAVRHSSSAQAIQLRLDAGRGMLHVEVEDGDPRPPVVRAGSDEGEGGRGLVIVDRIVSRWGWAPAGESGKSVWCDLRAT